VGNLLILVMSHFSLKTDIERILKIDQHLPKLQ